MTASASATEQFLARLGREREEFLRDHFAAAWGWYERLTSLCTLGRIHAWREECISACGPSLEGRPARAVTASEWR